MSAIQKLKTLLTVFLSLVIGLVLYTSPIAFADDDYYTGYFQGVVTDIGFYSPLNNGLRVINNRANFTLTDSGFFNLSIRDSSFHFLDSSDVVSIHFSKYNTVNGNLEYRYRVGGVWSSWSSFSLSDTLVLPGFEFFSVRVPSSSSIPSYGGIDVFLTVNGSIVFIDGSTAYSDGYSNGYDVGYSSGVGSVDTQSYYTTGYNDGYSIGYSDGLSRGSGDSPLSSVNRFYVPIDNYSVNATGNNNIFLNTDSFNNVWSAQEYYDLTGQTQFINTWLINTVTSSALRVTDGTFLVRAGSPFRISNIQIPKGAYPVITLHGVFVAGVGIGSNGSYAVNAPGVSGGVVYMPYSSFKLQLTRSTGISVSSLRAWFGDSNNQQFQSASTISSANASASYIFNSVDLDCFRADFEVSVTGPDYYFVSIGYYYDDPNSNLLAEILDRLDNGNSSTSSVVDKINGAIQSFDSSVSTINDFEDSMLGSFNNSSGTVNSTVSNFSFGRQFLNAANWISTSMQRIYSSSSHFQMFWVFPIILAVALVFIGGGIGSKHD